MFSRDAEPSLRGAAERVFDACNVITLGFADCASRLNWVTRLRLSQKLLHHVAMHIGEPVVAALEAER